MSSETKFEQELGEAVIALFNLKSEDGKKDRYFTTWGNKSACGIGACVIRIINEKTGEQSV